MIPNPHFTGKETEDLGKKLLKAHSWEGADLGYEPKAI